MERHVGVGPGERPLRGRVGEVDFWGVSQRSDRRAGGGELLTPPLDGVARRGEVVVVLDELAVVDKILAEIKHALDAVSQLERLRGVVDPADLAGRQPDGRAFDRINRTAPAALPGRSVLSCVPGARKSSTRCIVAGLTPAVAWP